LINWSDKGGSPARFPLETNAGEPRGDSMANLRGNVWLDEDLSCSKVVGSAKASHHPFPNPRHKPIPSLASFNIRLSEGVEWARRTGCPTGVEQPHARALGSEICRLTFEI